MDVAARLSRISDLKLFVPHPKDFCRELVSEEAHVRLLISAERHNRRRAFTTLLLELLPGASDCYFLCLAFSRSTAFPLFSCFCSTGIRLVHLLFKGSLGFLCLLGLRLRFRSSISSGRLFGSERLSLLRGFSRGRQYHARRSKPHGS